MHAYLLNLFLLIVRSSELLSAVKDALTSGGQSKVDQLISGALKQLKNARLKGDPNLNSALAALATESPHLFSSPAAVKVSAAGKFSLNCNTTAVMNLRITVNCGCNFHCIVGHCVS